MPRLTGRATACCCFLDLRQSTAIIAAITAIYGLWQMSRWMMLPPTSVALAAFGFLVSILGMMAIFKYHRIGVLAFAGTYSAYVILQITILLVAIVNVVQPQPQQDKIDACVSALDNSYYDECEFSVKMQVQISVAEDVSICLILLYFNAVVIEFARDFMREPTLYVYGQQQNSAQQQPPVNGFSVVMENVPSSSITLAPPTYPPQVLLQRTESFTLPTYEGKLPEYEDATKDSRNNGGPH